MTSGPSDTPLLAPLFDRLSQAVPGEPGDLSETWTLDEQALRASVRHEVAQVLGTRCPLSLEEEAALEPAERSVLDYGLPDVGTLGLASAEEVHRLERLIAHTVQAFEPRLEHLQVSVQAPATGGSPPVAHLTARLVGDPAAQALSLPLRLDRSGRLVEVDDEFEHPEG